eukprot:3753787-Rhodomonas_salina.1
MHRLFQSGPVGLRRVCMAVDTHALPTPATSAGRCAAEPNARRQMTLASASSNHHASTCSTPQNEYTCTIRRSGRA